MGDLVLELRPGQPTAGGLAFIGLVHHRQVVLNVLFDPGDMARDAGPGVVAIPVVDRLELAAINGHHRIGEQLHMAAQVDEFPAHLADRLAVVFAEIGNRLEVRHQPAGQPHQLDVTLGFPLQSAAGLNSIEITVDVDLQKSGGVIAGTAGGFWLNTFKTQLAQVQGFDKRFDHPNWIVLRNIFIKPFRK